MSDFFVSSEPREFYVWIDNSNHNANIVKSFTSIPENSNNLMFIPNPKFSGFISTFQVNLLNEYLAEYNFELARRQYFPQHPSRLSAVFLLRSEQEALLYQETHQTHTCGRTLKKVITHGSYSYSIHDAGWVDFLRLAGSKDTGTIHNVCQSYWGGIKVEDCQLQHYGKPWTHGAVFEVLLIGRVDFV